MSAEGVLLSRRQSGPCQGLWHIPGGTVRFGEPLTDAVRRVAAQEVGLGLVARRFLGYIRVPQSPAAELGLAGRDGVRDPARPGTHRVRTNSDGPMVCATARRHARRAKGLPHRARASWLTPKGVLAFPEPDTAWVGAPIMTALAGPTGLGLPPLPGGRHNAVLALLPHQEWPGRPGLATWKDIQGAALCRRVEMWPFAAT